VLAFAIIAALQILGLQTTSLVAVLGGVALAIGLALQDTVSDIASVAMLLAFRPFSLGQYVDIGGTEGTVKGIALFTTTLDTADNVRLIMPNSSVWGQVIKNYGVNDTRRIDLLIGVSYADDLSKVKTIIEQVIAEDARILAEPAPVVAVHELADSSVNLVVRPWCKREDYWTVRWDITQRVKEALEAQGCSIPFPQRDIHLIRESADVA
ncbi:MAG: mechanosensitive ion channel domain-containing protein, partial [Caldilineaceae bacterium]